MEVKSCLAMAAFVALIGCGKEASTTPAATAQAAAPAIVERVPQGRDADDTSRYLAGMPSKPSSPYAEKEDSPAWKAHKQLLDAAWKHTGDTLIAGLAEFQKSELSDKQLTDANVFYPFGGPDSLTPVMCYPKAANYVMVALEPPGTVPTPESIEKKNLSNYLPAIRGTMGSVLGRSFFITREMDAMFRGQITDGLMVPILHILVRTGHTITGYQYLTLDDAGKPVVREANWKAPGKHGNKGFEVSYKTDADGSVHHLSYYSVNLDDEHLADNTAFAKFVDSLKGSNTMFKSTSYMMHDKAFNTIREMTLKTAGSVLQDDSGMPYKFFQDGKWKVQLYGEYVQPYGSFRFRVQTDLRKAYGDPAVKPLPMRIGYGYGKVKSNLLLARRIGS